MRALSVLALCLSPALALGCTENAMPDEGVAINRGALGAAPDASGRYIVKFKNDHARGAAALHAAGGEVVLALPRHGAVAAHIPAQAIAGLSRNPNVDYIEPDAVRAPLAETPDYGIALTQADLVSEVTGPVTVCIIDSGYYAGHEDLSSANVTFAPDGGAGPANQDGSGHGTHVAGIVRALGGNEIGVAGVNPEGNLKLHIVRVFGDDGTWAYASSLVSALDRCRGAASGPLVVSMSLGGSFKSKTEENAFKSANGAGVLSIAAAGNDGSTRLSYPASYASVMSVAALDVNKVVADFSQKNAQVEIAAPGVAVSSTVPWVTDASVTVGDTTFDGHPVEFAASSAGASGVLVDGGLCDSVGAWAGAVVVCERGVVSFNDKVQNAQSGGAVAALIFNNVAGEELYATLGEGSTSAIPALGLTQADGQALIGLAGASATVVSLTTKPASGYEAWDGTSMATPYVSGIAALIWNHFPTASNEDVRAALTATAEDLAPAGRDTASGYGLVRAAAALDHLGGSTPVCTPTQTVETSCDDGRDNDCDGATDGSDSDCDTGGGTCDLGKPGEACTSNADCCSNRCKGKPGKKTCS